LNAALAGKMRIAMYFWITSIRTIPLEILIQFTSMHQFLLSHATQSVLPGYSALLWGQMRPQDLCRRDHHWQPASCSGSCSGAVWLFGSAVVGWDDRRRKHKAALGLLVSHYKNDGKISVKTQFPLFEKRVWEDF